MILYIIIVVFLVSIVINDYSTFRPKPPVKPVKRKYNKVKKLKVERWMVRWLLATLYLVGRGALVCDPYWVPRTVPAGTMARAYEC